MPKLLLTWLALIGLTISAQAQVPMTGAGLGAPASAPTYTGPGDKISGAVIFGSTARAYSASWASANGFTPALEVNEAAIKKAVLAGSLDDAEWLKFRVLDKIKPTGR